MVDFILDNQYNFILTMIRISSIFGFAIFYGDKRIPRTVKAGLAFMLTMLIFPNVETVISTEVKSIELLLLAISEFLIGFVIGTVTNLISMVFLIAGSLIDVQGGFSMAQVFDVTSQSQASLIGKLFSTVALLFFLGNDFHITLLEIIFNIFKIIPIGTSIIDEGVIKVMCSAISLGTLIAFPILCVIFLIDTILAISAKTMPQLNLFSIGFIVKTTITTFLVYIYTYALNALVVMVSNQMFNFINNL